MHGMTEAGARAISACRASCHESPRLRCLSVCLVHFKSPELRSKLVPTPAACHEDQARAGQERPYSAPVFCNFALTGSLAHASLTLTGSLPPPPVP